MNMNEVTVKYVGTAIPVLLHAELRQIAAREQLSMSGLLREVLIQKLEKERKMRRRRAK